MAERLATQAYVDAKFTGTGVLNGLPVNTIIRSTLPPSSTAFGSNWTYCDGKTLSKSDYPNLLGMYLTGNFSFVSSKKMSYSSNYDTESFYAEDPSGNSQGIVSLINHHGSNYDYNVLYICQDSSIKMLSNETHYGHQRISICGNYIFATYGGYNEELYCKRMNKDGSNVTSSTICADHGEEYSEVYSLNGKYFVFANNKIYQSSNGTSWTEAGSAPLYGLSNNWYVPMKYFNGKYFCFCGKYITGSQTNTSWDIYSTSDGINWTLSFSNLLATGTNGVTMPEFVVAEGVLYALYPINLSGSGSALSSGLSFGRTIICTGDGITWNIYGMTADPVERVIYNNGNFYGFDSSLRYVKRALLLTDIFSNFLDCSVNNFAGGTIATRQGKLIVPSYTSTSNNYLTILASTSNDNWDSQWIGANYKLDTSKITIPNITNSFIKIK